MGILGLLMNPKRPLLIHLAEPGDNTLTRTALGAIGLYQRPIGVALAILLPIAAPQVHTAILRIIAELSSGLVVTTRASELVCRHWPLKTKHQLLCLGRFLLSDRAEISAFGLQTAEGRLTRPTAMNDRKRGQPDGLPPNLRHGQRGHNESNGELPMPRPLKYSPEFRRDALERMKAGTNVTQLARDLGIRRKFLYL